MRRLTALTVANAKPKNGQRREIPDAGSGLYLVVQPSGAKSWAVRYRHASRPRKLTLGSTNVLTLAAARRLAADALHELEQGTDPGAAKIVARQAERDKASREAGDTIEAAVELFITQYAKRQTRAITARTYERMLRRFVIPRWRGRAIRSVRRRDIMDLIELIADTPFQANRLLAVLSKLFSWLVSRDRLQVSPVTGVARPHKEPARERVLDDAEIAALWSACNQIGGTAGDYVKILLLTGARRAEIGHMTWAEIDEQQRVLKLPAERCKNRKPHAVPLVDTAWEILAKRPRVSPFVFSARTGNSPITAFHHVKNHIDAAVQLPAFRLHDLRRSVASGLQKLGVRIEVIEAALGHTSGSFRGIVGVYQRHDYSTEKRDALQRWEQHVLQLAATGKPGKVVPMPRRPR